MMQNKTKNTTDSPVISVRQLSKDFGSFRAVDGLDMDIRAGQIYGFLGPNGSGKTTAIRMMCGLLQPSEGSVHIFGQDVTKFAEQVRLRVGYMTQRFSMYGDLSVRENLQFIADIRCLPKDKARSAINSVLKRYRLEEIAKRMVDPLSGGQKRRLALAAAVLHEPDILLLDEPTSEVDPNTRREMWEAFFALAATGTTVLVSSHLMDEAERCHHLTIMDHGKKVADGSTITLKNGLKGHVINVSGPDVTTLVESLRRLDEIIAVTQVGIQLRLLLQSKCENVPQRVLDVCGDDYCTEMSDPTIEDVFVKVTR